MPETDARHRFCPGYDRAPFADLVAEYPGVDVYPARSFRVEWGPIFHRGRLDGSARVLVLGQDPATHESVSRRILVGEAGQRVQGLLARIGITSSYVMVNAFLYSVYGQSGGTEHERDDAIAAYRNRWLDALLLDTQVTTVITLGGLARTAYATWAAGRPEAAGRLHRAAIRHPTAPESAAGHGQDSWERATAALLADWNAKLPGLREHVEPEADVDDRPYGTVWAPGDLVEIPEGDLPAGSRAWWGSLAAWAQRTGRNRDATRATIRVPVPPAARPWTPSGPS